LRISYITGTGESVFDIHNEDKITDDLITKKIFSYTSSDYEYGE
jgi:hypothetical protein